MTERLTLEIGTLLRSPKYTYRIKGILGQGGFGITYVAETTITIISSVKGALGTIEQEQKTTITVAVKEFFMKDLNGRNGCQVTTVQAGSLYTKYYQKFATEAQNLSKLSHKNIVSVVELFEANNTIYYVMEYIEGRSFEKYISERGYLPESEAIECLRQIAEALSYMHSHRMLHLDLKPGNIMRRHNRQLVLIDFGLSKQYNDDNTPESTTTIGAGTPGYAPIEQVSAHGGKDFPITLDIYALGATLYKMLTGKTPPLASDIMNMGFPAHELRIRNISEKTISIVQKAMMFRKADRYQTVEDLMVDFDKMPSEVVQSQDSTQTVIQDDGGREEETVDIQHQEAHQYQWPNGQLYVGEWKNKMMHGKGNLTYSDGRVYEGMFMNGLRHGKGTLTYPNNEKFVGEFVNDSITQNGIFYDENGNIKKMKKSLKEKFMLFWEEKRQRLKAATGLLVICFICISIAWSLFVHELPRIGTYVGIIGVIATIGAIQQLISCFYDD